MINVQFNADETAIIAYFASLQDSNFYPNLGIVDNEDARWKEFYEKMGGSTINLPPPA